jgi:hypothetical protein
MQNTPLTADGPIPRLFRAVGAHDFAGAALHVLRLPYGRITDRSRFWLVLEEGRGTCTTKHATLAELAREQGGLTCIPEAHCYLRADGELIDMTGLPAGAVLIERFLHEEPITIDQIGAYKIEVHRRFLRDWIPRTEAARGRSLDDVWGIREACIAALGAGAYATPTR